jgi:chloride channel 3/4/5
MTMSQLTKLLDDSHYSGFPIVSDLNTRILLGYIGRTELAYAIEKVRAEEGASPNAKCIFSADAPLPLQTPSALTPAVTFDDIDSTNGPQTIEFSRFMDPTPLAVHPRQPLETVMELFKKMGPRVILVEHKGKLVGLVTVKDCLKYQFQIEALEREEGGDSRTARAEKTLWSWLQVAGGSVAECTGKWTKGRIRLGSASVARDGLLTGPSVDPRDELEEIRGTILDDGTEHFGSGVELENQ